MTKIEVTCGKCKRKFYKEDYENKSCPHCGHVAKKENSSGGKPCFITTACVEAAGLPDNCTELETMRYLRDEYLAKSDEGKRMTQEYYEIAPTIVEKIGREENSKEIFGDIFSDIRGIVSLVKTGNLESATGNYEKMVLGLKQRYIKTWNMEVV
ncbi:MAG TPA: hypothetical protein ENH14_00880 [candidate division WOR-3 bacterium]|uniref:Uncharacterized protein n=1 Tax=candidate division WOR-3 bacterium TaxID=2052148 RepID=A0A7V0Q726_UNCW3|nr:hypothetical protein [candidate division WOR-3 bacterium]